MKLIAQITEPIAAILKHLGLPTTAPVPEAARLEPAEEQEPNACPRASGRTNYAL